MIKYHGTESREEITAKTGQAVFRDAKQEDIVDCEILVILAEFDPNETIDGNMMFVQEYRKKYNKLPMLEVLKGHNHVSCLYSMGLGGPGDVLGPRILSFMLQ